MIQFLADSIDQLDLALDQLALNDRNFDRFAFMLVDNVVELLLHKYAQSQDIENEWKKATGEPKNDPELVAKALGQEFDKKVKACCQLGYFDQTLRDSLLYLHQFRNTAYHRGYRHEGILHSLALFYCSCSCEILKLHDLSSWVSSSNDKISHRARKYIGSPSFHSYRESFEAAFVRLSDVVESMPQNLIEDLSVDFDRTISRADERIDFLATNDPVPKSRDQVILDTQAWSCAFEDEVHSFACENGCLVKGLHQYIEWISENYPWPVKRDPIDSWRNRHESLVSESDPHMALKKYVDFMKQTQGIRDMIDDASAKLDGYIQMQIDIARGK